MIKFNMKNIKKRTLDLCKDRASMEENITAPIAIYNRIRTAFTINKTVLEIVKMGYTKELVEAIKAETFKA